MFNKGRPKETALARHDFLFQISYDTVIFVTF